MGRLVVLAFIWGWSFLFIKVAVAGMTPTTVAAARIGLGAVVLLVVLWARHLGTVGTGVAYVLNYRIVADIGPTRASLVTYLIPVVAVVVGVVVLDEPFRLRMLAGGLLIVAGIALVHRRLRLSRRPARPPAPAPGAALSLVLAVGMVAVIGACGDRAGPSPAASASCGPSVTEPLDSSSAVHLLPGAVEPDYLSDPPTSGPHLSGRPPTGAVDAPVDRPTQVLLLEQGGVLIQYRDLPAAAVASLESLATESVVVAPNPDLAAPVVATAWRTKRTCTAAELGTLREFVDAHLGGGPEH